MANVRMVMAKLGNMRKPEEFIVYPNPGAKVVVQSDHRIAAFDPETGVGTLSKYRSNGAYFLHLNTFLGATAIVVPPALIAEFVGAVSKSGDKIGAGVYVG